MCPPELIAFGKMFDALMTEMHSITQKQPTLYEETNAVSGVLFGFIVER